MKIENIVFKMSFEKLETTFIISNYARMRFSKENVNLSH